MSAAAPDAAAGAACGKTTALKRSLPPCGAASSLFCDRIRGADRAERAAGAFGVARGAVLAPEQNKPVAKVRGFRRGDQLAQRVRHLDGVLFVFDKAEPVGQTDTMRIVRRWRACRRYRRESGWRSCAPRRGDEANLPCYLALCRQIRSAAWAPWRRLSGHAPWCGTGRRF